MNEKIKELMILNLENIKLNLEENMKFLLPQGINVDGIEKTIKDINIEIEAIEEIEL